MVVQDSLWQSRKIEIASTGTTANCTVGNVVAALGILKIDFYVDQVAVWCLGGNSLQVTVGTGALANGTSIIKKDWGTPDNPAAIGFNVPKALANVRSGVQSTATDVLLSAQPVAGTSATGTYDFVFHLWVVYRPSA